jgi:Zn-dependent protease with chaperone function
MMAMVVAGLIAAIVLWLVDRTHQWYLLTAAAIVIVCIAWSYASPYFVLPGARIEVPAAVADRLHPLLVRAGEPNLPIVLDDRSEVETAVVQGLGASRRVAISQVLLAADTPGEIDFAVALSLGHINHDDQLRGALILAAIVIVAATLAVAIADRIRFRRDDDSVSRLALVGALMAVVYLFAVPVRNATLRTLDLGADRYAVALTRDPASGVRLAVRVADQRMDEICPEALPQLMLAVHPSPSERIAAIAGSPSGCP